MPEGSGIVGWVSLESYKYTPSFWLHTLLRQLILKLLAYGDLTLHFWFLSWVHAYRFGYGRR